MQNRHSCGMHAQVVAKDAFNSDPDDPEVMSEEVRNRLKAGETLPIGYMKIPMVDLPLGATEDRVCGTIDIEKALSEGEMRESRRGYDSLLHASTVLLQTNPGQLKADVTRQYTDICIYAQLGSSVLCPWHESQHACHPFTTGVKAFEPGLLAKANRGILYVDEVNLLDDHLVDVLLDSAASGGCKRQSCASFHAARGGCNLPCMYMTASLRR